MTYTHFSSREKQAEHSRILDRYSIIIRYFLENPWRAEAERNEQTLEELYHNDKILMTDETLRAVLLEGVLNSEGLKLSRLGVK